MRFQKCSYSQLSLTDTSIRWTPSVGPCRCSVILLWEEGWAGAFGNVIDKKHMAHPPLPFGTKMTDPPLKQGWKLLDPPPS